VFAGSYYWSNKLTGKSIRDAMGSVTLDGFNLDVAICGDVKCSENSFAILVGGGFGAAITLLGVGLMAIGTLRRRRNV
jgi:hypothetical protein